MDAARSLGERPRRARRPDRRRRDRTARCEPYVGPSTRVIELRGRTVTPGFQDAHVHPVHGGLDDAPLRPPRGRGCPVPGTTGSRPTRRPIRTRPWIRGGGWYMAAFEGGTPRREDLDRIVPDRPAFLTNRDGHSAWVNSRALELAGITADTADPNDGRIERDPDGTPTGTLHEGAMDLVARLLPDDTPGRPRGGAAPRPAAPARVRHHGLAGRHHRVRSRGTRLRGAGEARRADGPRRRRDVVGMEARAPSRSTSSSSGGGRRPSAATGPTSVKLMMDGVIENFTGAMLEPVRRRQGRHDRQPRAAPDRPRRAGELGPAARRARLPAPLPRDRRPGRAVGARRGRGGAAGERPVGHAPPHRPHPGHPSRRHRALPRARRRRQRPAAVGRPRGPDGHPDDPVHRRALALAVPVPLAASGRCGARHGLGLERLEPEPAVGDARWPSNARPPDRRPAERDVFLPDERLDLIDALAGFTDGVRLREPPRRRDRDASRSASSPISRSSTATCSTAAPAPSARRASSARSSRASPCSRTPRSTADGPRAAWTDDDVGLASDVGVRLERRRARCSICAPGLTGATQKGAIKP